MNRRWQKDGVGQYDSLPSLSWMISQLPPLPVDAGLADTADVYSVLSALHAKRRNPQPAACIHQGFYYFLADLPAVAQQGLTESSDGTSRREPVVPISSKHQTLTMQRLATLFQLEQGGPPVSHLLLAIVDDDGSVSLMRCFPRIQPPYEGQGILLDALGTSGTLPHDSEDDEG